MIYNKICLMVPTYGRSTGSLPIFIQSAMGMTANRNTICFCFCVNNRDTETQNFLNKFNFCGFKHEIIIENSITPHLANYYNQMWKETITRSEPGTLVTMLGDDMEFKTPAWERTIFDWVNRYDGIGVYHCNDFHRAKHNCPVNLFVTRKMIDLTGRPFMCPEFEAEMIDIVWYYVGKVTKTLHYFPNIIIQHNHNTKKRECQWDNTFKRLNVFQCQVHQRGGKKRAIEIGMKIGMELLAKNIKGIPGDSDC